MVLCFSLAPAALADPGEPFLGILLQKLDDDLREHFDYKGKGIMVIDIIENTGADKSDLKQEDIITAIDGEKIADVDDIKKALSTAKPGEKVAVTVFRDKQNKVVLVEISDKGESTWESALENAHKWVYFPRDDRPWIGIALEGLTPQLAEYFGTESGVLVKEVLKDSPAEKAKLKAGDVIVEWNGENIENAEEMFKRLDIANPEDKISLVVMRKGKKKKVRVVLGQPKPEADHLYGFSKKGLGSDKRGSKYGHPGMEKLPLPYFKSHQKASEYTEDRLIKIEEQVQDLAGELRRLVEKLDTETSDETGKQ